MISSVVSIVNDNRVFTFTESFGYFVRFKADDSDGVKVKNSCYQTTQTRAVPAMVSGWHEVRVGFNRNRTMLALGALAAFGALEIAALCGAVAFILEILFGIDLPIVNWIVTSLGSTASESGPTPDGARA